MKTEQADLIIHNAFIYKVDAQFTTAEAMAIKDGKIIAIGPEREIMNKYSAPEKMDAGKKPVYPGFIDAHCHFLGYGLTLQQVDLVGTKSYDEVLERTVAFAKTSKAEWIEGRGWDQNDWPTKTFPTRAELDSLFPNRPVLLKRIDGHAAIVNSAALERAGITPGKQIDGGIFQTKNGQLTGLLIDNAVDSVAAAIPQPNAETLKQALLQAQENCFAAGITTVSDAGLSKHEVEAIDQLQQAGQLKMKVYAMLTNNQENFDHYLKSGPYKTDRLNVCSFKFYADGALGSRGAALLEPYADDPENYGLFIHPKEYLLEHAKKVHEAGFQMNTHCIGDSANRLVLDIYAKVLKTTNDKRWRIEHAQVVHPNDLAKYKQYNVLPSVQPTHATSDMEWADERLGNQRVKTAYAWADLLQQNGMLPLGTDFPVEHISPIYTFFAAVFRKDHNGHPADGYQMENALTREQTIMGMTIWAALANFEENEKGSLEVGKAADFVMLDRDLMLVPEEDILQTKVLHTFVNGEQVFGE